MSPSAVSLWNGTPPRLTLVQEAERAPAAVCQHVVSVCQDFFQPSLSPMLSAVPPPPPPLLPPPDELEPPPKPPFADEEEEEEMLLRETCLMSMANKRVMATEVCVRVFLCCLTLCQEVT